MWTWEIEGFGQPLVTLDNIEAFRALSKEARGDVSLIRDTEAARAVYGSYGALQAIVRLRELYIRKYRRGAFAEDGKVLFVQFSSALTAQEDAILEKNLEALRSRL